jgi:hypothetical protein
MNGSSSGWQSEMLDPLRQELNQAFARLEWPHYGKLIKYYGLPKNFMLQLPEHEIGIDDNRLVIATGYLEDGTIEDLLYFRPCRPDQWELKRGFANFLGRWDQDIDDPRIWKTPLEWLQHGGVGRVPLNDSAWQQLEMLKLDLGVAA